MISRAGWSFGTDRGDDKLNRTLAVNAFGADHELYSVVAADIGDETGILRAVVLQHRITASGCGREGPVKAQWLI